MMFNDQPVITLDEGGAIAGAKPHEEIDGENDILHAVHLFCITPDGKLLLSRTPDLAEPQATDDALWSTSAATLMRMDEDRDDAALRLLADDLGNDDGNPVYLSDTLDRGDNDLLRLHSTYYAMIPTTPRSAPSDGREFAAVGPDELDEMLRSPDAFSPWCLALLEHHRYALPF